MPTIEMQKTDNRCGSAPDPLLAWRRISGVDMLESSQSYLAVWEPIGTAQKYSPERSLTFCDTPSVNYNKLTINRPEKIDPFTQEDRLDTEETQLQELIFRFVSSLPTRSMVRIVNRLSVLLNIAREEDESRLGIKIGSLRNFYNFLQLNADLKCPAISLTPDSNIYASWRGENNRVFSIHFLPTNEDARFVILKPNERHPGRQVQVSGSATIDIIMKMVEQFKVLSWAKE